jgi:hypothetical protein
MAARMFGAAISKVAKPYLQRQIEDLTGRSRLLLRMVGRDHH